VEFQGERAEIEALLRSGIFSRAPHLVSFLTYICARYFEGQAGQIKEYTIGVEAFGRTAAFDPKKDSIVRVEAHRLRKRLSEYYAGAGAEHRIRILIPNGQYIPRFLIRDDVPRDAPRRKRWPIPTTVLGICGLAMILTPGIVHSRLGRQFPKGEERWIGSFTEPVPAEFRMLAGYHGPPFTDRQGQLWTADTYFTGGHSSAIPPERRIEGAPDPNLLKTQRSGTFHYDIPLGKGTYELHLYFAETEYGPGNPRGGGESSRIFQISVNNVTKIELFDPLAESGAPNRLKERVFKDISPAADGKLHIGFAPSTAPAFLNAVEILPSSPGMIRPVRIVAQDRSVTDADGHFWAADEYFCGGTLVLRSNTVADPREKALYRGERYGHFTYDISLAPGKYRLTLHFAETWFGSPESHEPAIGARIFNVFSNGVALLRDFDIARQAGMIAEVSAVFNNLQPNAQGVLSLEFVPVKNYAEVNAIEVVETE